MILAAVRADLAVAAAEILGIPEATVVVLSKILGESVAAASQVFVAFYTDRTPVVVYSQPLVPATSHFDDHLRVLAAFLLHSQVLVY